MGLDVVGAELTGADEAGAKVVEVEVVEVEVVEEVVVDVVVTLEEHPAVRLTSLNTVSDHAPFISCCATQKKAPPLHSNTPLL